VLVLSTRPSGDDEHDRLYRKLSLIFIIGFVILIVFGYLFFVAAMDVFDAEFNHSVYDNLKPLFILSSGFTLFVGIRNYVLR
jgi:hypothetical protein